MGKIISFIFVASVVGTFVMLWANVTASGPRQTQHASPAQAFTADQMHRNASFSDQKFHDMSFVYSQER